MDTKMTITVQTTINSDIESVWNKWSTPEDVKNWNAASEDWHTTHAEMDLKEGGEFLSRMEAKDGSMDFDFKGIYKVVNKPSLIIYTIDDGREVKIEFKQTPNGIKVIETIEAESTHTAEQQKQRWQSILSNFAKYVESS
jgi:uncharacterized protein YndB with AHSA1/START domain